LTHEDDAAFSHEIDHIIGPLHGGETIADNLAYAGTIWNRFKGPNVSPVDALGVIVRLFHPRSQPCRTLPTGRRRDPAIDGDRRGDGIVATSERGGARGKAHCSAQAAILVVASRINVIFAPKNVCSLAAWRRQNNAKVYLRWVLRSVRTGQCFPTFRYPHLSRAFHSSRCLMLANFRVARDPFTIHLLISLGGLHRSDAQASQSPSRVRAESLISDRDSPQ